MELLVMAQTSVLGQATSYIEAAIREIAWLGFYKIFSKEEEAKMLETLRGLRVTIKDKKDALLKGEEEKKDDDKERFY